jgi:hypothetical protein
MAVLKTRAASQSVELIDVSDTGAKSKSAELQKVGEELFVAIERIEVFAIVVWAKDGEYGITFDEPLSSFKLHALQLEAKREGRLQTSLLLNGDLLTNGDAVGSTSSNLVCSGSKAGVSEWSGLASRAPTKQRGSASLRSR